MLDDLFQVTFQLLQLCCQLLGITACFASFFLSPGGHGLLPLGQLLQLAGKCGGLIELRFTGRLQQFLLFFQQILQLLIQLLLFVLQPLPFGCQLLLKILGGLPGGRRAVPLLLLKLLLVASPHHRATPDLRGLMAFLEHEDFGFDVQLDVADPALRPELLELQREVLPPPAPPEQAVRCARVLQARQQLQVALG